MFRFRMAVAAAAVILGCTATGFAQQGGCQRGGGGGAAGGGANTGATGASNLAGLRAGGTTAGATGTTVSSALGGLQLYQQQGAQFRQAQLNALAANAQIRAESQAMWENARQRKQQALAMRQSRERFRASE